jgi:hypothetical protein
MSTKKKFAGGSKETHCKVVYTINHYKEGKPVSWLKENKLGGCDAMLAVSVIRPPDGSLSTLFMSLEGATGEEMTGDEKFKIWMLLASHLMKSESLRPACKQFAEQVFDIYRKAILGADDKPKAKA